MNRQTWLWLGGGFGAAIGSVVLAMNRIVWPAALLSLLAIICSIQIRRSAGR